MLGEVYVGGKFVGQVKEDFTIDKIHHIRLGHHTCGCCQMNALSLIVKLKKFTYKGILYGPLRDD